MERMEQDQRGSPSGWTKAGGRKEERRVVWEEIKDPPPLEQNLQGLTITCPKSELDEYMGATRMLERVKEKMDRAKRKHRSSLKLPDWHKYRLWESYDSLQRGHVARVKELNRKHMEYRNRGEQPPANQVVTGIDRVHWKDLSLEDFIEKYQKPEIPVIITGLTDKWKGSTTWNLEELFQGRYRNCRLKVGEDDEGYSIRVKLKYFLNYMLHNIDDSPMYLFDCSFDEHDRESELLGDYQVPFYFKDDLFNLISEKRRPPYRWFLIGPKRSGTSAHVDPLGTSAWNALVKGRKRWLLTKPGTRKRQVKGYEYRRKSEDGEAAIYFSYVVPRILKAEAEKKVRDMGIREVIQEPGEVIYVPGGWYHAVLNITHTVAVTQNFCARAQFLKIWRHARKGRKKMSRKWLESLKLRHPDLAEMALKCNEDEGFEMKNSSSSKKKRKKRRDRSRSKTRSSSDDREKSSKKRNSDRDEGSDREIASKRSKRSD
mmetsp:Transcript_13194/g.25254  ORF Transcript_13194/g.25254 Transcript_13194/m.25254 type:complete len:486 (-) Transcript_13194:278-1735(-)